MKKKTINLTYKRAVAIMKAADVVWSETDSQAGDQDWKAVLRDVTKHFPALAKRFSYVDTGSSPGGPTKYGIQWDHSYIWAR